MLFVWVGFNTYGAFAAFSLVMAWTPHECIGGRDLGEVAYLRVGRRLLSMSE